jgi:hypothetical protein
MKLEDKNYDEKLQHRSNRFLDFYVFICVPTKFPMCYRKVLNGFSNLFPKMSPIAPQFVPHALTNIILLEPLKERECSIVYVWSDNFYIEESPKFQNSFELGD